MTSVDYLTFISGMYVDDNGMYNHDNNTYNDDTRWSDADDLSCWAAFRTGTYSFPNASEAFERTLFFGSLAYAATYHTAFIH